MNDHEFDMSLKQRANTEADPVPAGLEARLQAAVDQLPERTVTKRSSRNILRPVLVAAVIAALTGTVLAAGSEFNFLTFFNGSETRTVIFEDEFEETIEKEQSLIYGISGEQLTYFPVESLSDELREAAKENGDKTAIVNQLTWKQAETFLGMELANSSVLKRCRQVGFGWQPVGSDSIEICRHQFWLFGEEPRSIEIITFYLLKTELEVSIQKPVSITLNIRIETDANEVPVWHTTWGNLKEGWTKEEYLTAEGLETVIIGDMGNGENGHRYHGVFVLNGMIYTLDATGSDAEQVVTVLKEVLDGFQ